MSDRIPGLSIGCVKILGKELNVIRGGGPSCCGCFFESNGSPSWCCQSGVNCSIDGELVIFVEVQDGRAKR